MRLSILLTYCLIPLWGFPQGESEPTLEETSNWLEKKFEQSNISGENGYHSRMNFNKEDTTLNYLFWTTTNGILNHPGYTLFVIDLKELNPKGIFVEEVKGMSKTIHIKCNNSKGCIDQYDVKDLKENKKEKMVSLSRADLYIYGIKEENIAQRTKEALIHLIKLCGGTGEDF